MTNVNGSFSVLGKSLTTVIWRPGGDFAYVGAADGSVWKFAEHTGFERLENLGTSEVNDIACHRNYNVCFLATMDEGIAVVDEGHAVVMGRSNGSGNMGWYRLCRPCPQRMRWFRQWTAKQGYPHQHH